MRTDGQVGGQAGGQADVKQLIVSFCDFSGAPKKQKHFIRKLVTMATKFLQVEEHESGNFISATSRPPLPHREGLRY